MLMAEVFKHLPRTGSEKWNRAAELPGFTPQKTSPGARARVRSHARSPINHGAGIIIAGTGRSTLSDRGWGVLIQNWTTVSKVPH